MCLELQQRRLLAANEKNDKSTGSRTIETKYFLGGKIQGACFSSASEVEALILWRICHETRIMRSLNGGRTRPIIIFITATPGAQEFGMVREQRRTMQHRIQHLWEPVLLS